MIFKSTGKRGLFDEQNAIDLMSEMGNSLERLNKVVDFDMFRPLLEDKLTPKGLARLMKLWDLLPTPTATDATRGGEILTSKTKLRKSDQRFSATLNDLAKSGLLPTPVASDKNGGSTRTDPNVSSAVPCRTMSTALR